MKLFSVTKHVATILQNEPPCIDIPTVFWKVVEFWKLGN